MKKMLYIIVGILSLALYSCKENPANPNIPPNTVLTNIPPENDSTNPYFPILEIYWKGKDTDGFIKGYEYRYTTRHLCRGDSFYTTWTFTEAGHDTIIFESSDTLNLQRFMVRAVDNNGDCDPTPAKRFFYTPLVVAPETEISSPQDGDTFFVLLSPSDWWEGVPLMFTGYDPDPGGAVVDYSYKVDSKPWSDWQKDTSVVLVPSDFDSLSGPHTVMVKSRDNTGIEDPTPAEVGFVLLLPSMERSMLLVDDTKDGGGGPGNPTDEQVDDFYASILGGYEYDEWDLSDSNLTKAALANHRIVFWHADHKSYQEHNVFNYIDLLQEYLNVGGKLFLGGWKVLYNAADTSAFPDVFLSGSFVYDYLHIRSADEDDYFLGDFLGATGVCSLAVDVNKLYSPMSTALTNVCVLLEGAFTEPILYYESLSDDSEFDGKPCGIFYRGTVYDVVFFGFPLYYIEEDDAREFVNIILAELLGTYK
ncbi:hypothetical protein CH333_03710 [candidate division WOR-3 bacterium JGI_Cruoil_03_44_89]|uniref:Fibronectin type-III domain-containing protein n=1 Tax=candidate division WOR-3 bacterium JGI_Cruoil_03_44_89 TaxID=1973748 RepID=A0A235BUY0_UNCW3|nr:MAG: hypothetical protein CH333_04500 [candidate division WOR-3 bacterium JGI_Cruoil_03_44_89]OYD16316.1 MAG: hypothetical protein CH333_03710 [candidate division WOR-3 bacterium JGI_Cruoil_03_44_89]